MSRSDPRKLRDAAAQALRKGNSRKALGLYLKLEKLELQDGGWPQRAAEMYARLAQTAQQVEALKRAGECFARAGFLLKAIAVCKRILTLDPEQTHSQEMLAELYAERGFPVQAAREPLHLEPDAPLDGLRLSDVIPAAHPARLAGEAAGGMAEIPLETPRLEGASEAPLEIELEEDADPGAWLEQTLHAVDEPSLHEVEPVPSDPSTLEAARKTLPRTPLFSSLDRPHLRRLIENVGLVTLESDEELFREGEPGDALYVVVEGSVLLIAEGEVRKVLATIEAGQFFGEIALVTDQPRTATARALVDSTLLSIDRATVAALIEESPAVLQILLRFLWGRLARRIMRTSPLFAHLERKKRVALARRLRFWEASDGCVFVRQGEPSDALFVLLSGELEVSRGEGDEVQSLARLQVGQFFGEMSLLSGDPAVASVVSRGKSWVLGLPRDDVQALLEEDPRVRDVIESLVAQRRSENEISQSRLPYVDGKLDLV